MATETLYGWQLEDVIAEIDDCVTLYAATTNARRRVASRRRLRRAVRLGHWSPRLDRLAE